MRFKDKTYYVNKIQYWVGMMATAIAFDAIVLWIMCA